jgi:branched-chain amino acid transport system permease protein
VATESPTPTKAPADETRDGGRLGSVPALASARRFTATNRFGKYLLPALALLLVASYPWWPTQPIDMDTVFVMAVYVMLALGLNIVVGYAGLLDLGYVAFFALGAYTVGWFGSDLFSGQIVHFGSVGNPSIPGIHLSFWLLLIISGVVTAIAGVIIGWPTLRLRGDYLAIVTLGFGEIIPDVFRNGDAFPVPKGVSGGYPFVDFSTENVTNGVRGVRLLDRPGFGEKISDITGGQLPDRFTSADLTPWFLTIVIMVLVTIFVNQRLRDSKMGRAWIAVREDEVAASAMGVPLMRTKLWAYGIGAVFGGFAGAFYGSFIGSVFPTSFFFNISIIILVMVIVGGMGNIAGVIAGAVAVQYLNVAGMDKIGTAVNEGLNYVGVEQNVDIPKYKFLVFGILLVSMMLFRPEGLIPSARRKAEFHEAEEEPPASGVSGAMYEARS